MNKISGLIMVGLLLVFSCSSRRENSERKTEDKTISSEAYTNPVASTVIDKPVYLSKTDFLDKVMDYEKNPQTWVFKGDLPCMIDFYADWCAPCRLTAPILDELAKEYAGQIIIYKIDIQKEKELAAVFGIQGIPAFLYCPLNGAPSMTSGIGRSVEDTKNMFRQHIQTYLLSNSAATGT